MESNFFTASDGVKIHYLTQGDAGSWCVLIHGFTDTAVRMWFRSGIADALSPKHRVVALDNRNHGRSDAPTPGGTGRAEDTIELMAHLGITKAHIHGYSMGGGITGRILASNPELFITAGFGGSGISETDPELAAAAAKLDPVAPPAPEGTPARPARGPRAGRPGGMTPRPPLQIDLTTVTVPVICINGEFDRPYSKSQRMWRELKTFQNVVIPGKSHMTAIAVGGPMPQEYIRAMAGFIDTYDDA